MTQTSTAQVLNSGWNPTARSVLRYRSFFSDCAGYRTQNHIHLQIHIFHHQVIIPLRRKQP